MKKILFGCLLALGFGCGLQAQGVDIYVNGKLMADGDEMTITRATVEGNNMLHAFTVFQNTGSTAVTLTGKKEATLPEDVYEGWCLWENCMVTDEIEAVFALDAGEMFGGPTEYLDITPKGYVGDGISITYTFSTKENPDQTTTFTLKWVLGKPTMAPVNMTVDGQEVGQDKFIKIERPTQTTGMITVDIAFDNTGTESVDMAADRGKFLAPGTSTEWCMFGNCFITDHIEGMEPLEPGLTESNGDHPQYLEYTPKGYVGESVVYYSIYTAEDPFNRVDFAVRWVTTAVQQAQDVDIYVNGKLMSEGDTLTLTRATVEGNNMLHAFTVFHNTGDAKVTMTGKKVPALPEGVENGWCIWENCNTLDEITAAFELEVGEIFQGPTEYLDITPKGYVGDDIYVTYTFSTKEKPSATTTFTLRWILGKPTMAPVNMTVDGQEVGQDKFIKIERPTQATGMITVDIAFDNTGTESVDMAADRGKFLAPGTSTEWCMFGNCFMTDHIEGMESLEPGLTESNGDHPQYLEYTPKGYVGESVVYYSIYTKDDPFNRTDFAVRWVTTEGKSANENMAEAVKATVYPNPAATMARLTWEAVEGPVTLNVRSVSGQLLYSRLVEGLTEAEINVAGFTPGMYFYTLERRGERLAGGKLLVR